MLIDASQVEPEPILLEVGLEEAGIRLDLFLSNRLDEVSRSLVQRWILSDRVQVDQRRRRPSYAVSAGQQVEIRIPAPEPLDLAAEPIPLRILYEDDQIVVLDKPAGLVVHPGAGHLTGTLANALVYHFESISRSQSLRPGIVHRLDKETSGVMVVAKTERAHEQLSDQFKRREVEKEYLALVYGQIPSEQGRIELPLGRDRYQRTRISPRSRKLRPAVTEYQVLSRLEEFSYLRVMPRTGRTHQIRVHLQQHGYPVVGDALYAGSALKRVKDAQNRSRIKDLRRHFLHASRLAFRHPDNFEPVAFETPLPSELAKLLASLGE